jgi:hypothetical protein
MQLRCTVLQAGLRFALQRAGSNQRRLHRVLRPGKSGAVFQAVQGLDLGFRQLQLRLCRPGAALCGRPAQLALAATYGL